MKSRTHEKEAKQSHDDLFYKECEQCATAASCWYVARDTGEGLRCGLRSGRVEWVLSGLPGEERVSASLHSCLKATALGTVL